MDGRTLLRNELHARQGRNSSYSLRAFARDLGISPTALSQYLSHKRELSNKNSASITEKLRLSPAEITGLRSTRVHAPREALARELMNEDTFRMISDWLSLAVLSLARTPDAQAKPGWIADRLGVSPDEAKAALERVLRLGLVAARGGKLSRTSRAFATTSDVPSAAIKRFHADLLLKARDSLLDTPVEDRDVTAIVMPTNEAKLEEAKRLIRQMRHKIAALVSKEPAEEVYALSVQLFPLTRKDSQPRGHE